MTNGETRSQKNGYIYPYFINRIIIIISLLLYFILYFIDLVHFLELYIIGTDNDIFGWVYYSIWLMSNHIYYQITKVRPRDLQILISFFKDSFPTVPSHSATSSLKITVSHEKCTGFQCIVCMNWQWPFFLLLFFPFSFKKDFLWQFYRNRSLNRTSTKSQFTSLHLIDRRKFRL